MKRPRFHTLSSGFSLMEVLVALAIFAVAISAVASLFPAAALLQRRAMDEVLAAQCAENAEATIKARTFSEWHLTKDNDTDFALINSNPDYDTNQEVSALPNPSAHNKTWLLPYDINALGINEDREQIALADRSMPFTEANPLQRAFYWVPLVLDADRAEDSYDWRVLIFILKRDENGVWPKGALGNGNLWANEVDDEAVPGVRSAAVEIGASAERLIFNEAVANFNDTNGDGKMEHIQKGDSILDSHGYVYIVKSADATGFAVSGFVAPTKDTGKYPKRVWYAPPYEEGRRSPTRRIITVTDGVELK